MRQTLVVAKTLLLTACLANCKTGTETDGSVADASLADGSTEEYLDAGLLGVGGCVSPDGEKFMVRLQHVTAEGIFTCALISFRKDAGPSLYTVKPPAGYQVAEARYSNSCDFEQADGRLSTTNTAPIGRIWGEIQLDVIFQGRAQSFFIDGGVVLGTRLFGYQTDYAASSSVCRGN